MHLAENIRFLRERKGISQEELAKYIGNMRASAVGNWEAGRREPDISTLIKLADYFEVSLDTLIRQKLKPSKLMYAKNMNFLRAQHGINHAEMAKLLGIQNRQYRNIEDGRAEATVEQIEKVCDFFGTTIERLTHVDLMRERFPGLSEEEEKQLLKGAVSDGSSIDSTGSSGGGNDNLHHGSGCDAAARMQRK